MKDLDVFIEGEFVNLCIPTESFARNSNWYSWFNSKKNTSFLEQGMYPNTPEKQVDFFLSQGANRLILIVSDKNNYVGVVSLSKIDLVKKTCDVAIVMDGSANNKMLPYLSLEAMARITEHAFSMGINRIQAGQHIKLKGWQQRMELIGYKLEGLCENKFIKGREISRSLLISCLYDDFNRIANNRKGLWDSLENMRDRCKKLPKESFLDKFNKFHETERDSYYKSLFLL